MGKQLSIHLTDDQAKRLSVLAWRECRRPAEQARWMLLSALNLMDSEQPVKDSSTGVRQDLAGATEEVNR
jgi:hypothetical protein